MVEQIITSFLDTDLYKLTMQAAIHFNYPDKEAVFKLTNRTVSKTLNKAGFEWLKVQIEYLNHLRFEDNEIAYLKEKIGYLGDEYFNWLKTFKFDTKKEIRITSTDIGNDLIDLEIYAIGSWDVVTLYEIPILALVSESYFRFVDTTWTINGERVVQLNTDGTYVYENFGPVIEQSFSKSKKLLENGCMFSEFGTRRRRSKNVQHSVMEGIMESVRSFTGSGKFLGTSNVLFAKEFNVNPIGTIGHEWMMGIGAIHSINEGYESYLKANLRSVEKYVGLVTGKNAGLALTDTYGTNNFLQNFKEPYLKYYVGVRQDSGDPFEYAEKLNDFYISNGYSNKSKLICFSDSLNVEKCLKLKQKCDILNIGCAFGIGTNFTNDFDSEPMNIVMKLVKCGGGEAIKISDNIGKNMGDPTTVEEVKKLLSYEEAYWKEGDESHRWTKN